MTIVPTFLNGNGRDKICKHFQHFIKNGFYINMCENTQNKHMVQWHTPIYFTLQWFWSSKLNQVRDWRREIMIDFHEKLQI